MPNISRSKGNQTMKFGQLIEYNMRNIFLEKSYSKCDGETSLRPFSEKLKLSISLDFLTTGWEELREKLQSLRKNCLLCKIKC